MNVWDSWQRKDKVLFVSPAVDIKFWLCIGSWGAFQKYQTNGCGINYKNDILCIFAAAGLAIS